MDEPCCGVCARLALGEPPVPAERGEDWRGPLIVRWGELAAVVSAGRPHLTVGRGSSADLVVKDAKIARLQCRFEWRDGEVWVVDERSACGTMVGGRLVAESAVGPGDEVLIGDSVLSIETRC